MKKKQKTVLHINPPPRDRRCECCQRHTSELKPFGKAGDPLVGDFDGALLLKNFRPDFYHIKEYDEILNRITEMCRSTESWEEYEKCLIEEVGKEKAQDLLGYEQAVNSISASWECRDCFIMDGKEYFDKRHDCWEKRMKDEMSEV